jgi:hypothetical protein
VAGTRVWKRAKPLRGADDLARGCGPIDPVHAQHERRDSRDGKRAGRPRSGRLPMLPTAKRQMLRTLGVTRDGRAAEGLLGF